MAVRILVTGGTGYIGYRFLSELREHHTQHFSPVAIARTQAKAVLLDRLLDAPTPPTLPPVVIADLHDIESLRNAVRGVQVVVHLAADMDMFPARAGRVMNTNVTGTRNLLQACAEEAQSSGCRIRFVYVSSTEAIGPSRNATSVADEAAPLTPDCEYGRSKGMAENVVKEYSSTLDYVILRLSGVYGPGERYFFYEFVSMINDGLLIVAPGPLTGRISLAHIDDVVQGILLAVKHPDAVGETYILTADDCHTYKAIAGVIATSLHRQPPHFTVPLAIAKIAIALLAPLANFGKRRIFMFHPATMDKTLLHRVYSNEKMKRELGYQPKHRTLEGIQSTIEFELETGGLTRRPVSMVLSVALTLFSMMTFAVMNIGNFRKRAKGN